MIKDFNTYVKEGRLSRNLQTSFSGNVRTEDDINNLKKREFFEYLKEHYPLTNPDDGESYLCVDFCGFLLYEIFDKSEKLFCISLSLKGDNIDDKTKRSVTNLLLSKYSVEKNDKRELIKYKDGTFNNRLFLDILDDLLSIKNPLSEGILGRNLQTSFSDNLRKEDTRKTNPEDMTDLDVEYKDIEVEFKEKNRWRPTKQSCHNMTNDKLYTAYTV